MYIYSKYRCVGLLASVDGSFSTDESGEGRLEVAGAAAALPGCTDVLDSLRLHQT